MNELIALKRYDGSARLSACRVLCSVAFAHAENAKMLIVAGNFTSAVGLLRLQYEALARAIWLLEQALRASNGVSMMVGMLLVILSGDPAQRGRIPELQQKFADCLPPH